MGTGPHSDITMELYLGACLLQSLLAGRGPRRTASFDCSQALVCSSTFQIAGTNYQQHTFNCSKVLFILRTSVTLQLWSPSQSHLPGSSLHSPLQGEEYPLSPFYRRKEGAESRKRLFSLKGTQEPKDQWRSHSDFQKCTSKLDTVCGLKSLNFK